jgi:hypothetical protein
LLPEARHFPSGEKETAVTLSVCLSSEIIILRSNILQTFTVESALPEAKYLLSGEKATAVTLAECPTKSGKF